MKLGIMLGLTTIALGSQPANTKAETTNPGNALVGSLFYTPLERDAIDRGNVAVNSNGESSASDQTAPVVLRFNGRVERSGGRTSAWVSGQPLKRVQPGLPDARLRLQGERLRIETAETTRWLKAGEQFVPERSQATDSSETPSNADATNEMIRAQ